MVSNDEKEALDDQDGEGGSSPEGGSRKLQLSVLSRSWWATGGGAESECQGPLLSPDCTLNQLTMNTVVVTSP